METITAEPLVWILVALLLLESVLLLGVLLVYRTVRNRPPRASTVEAVAEAQSRFIQDLEARERWERIDLGRMHELNREEVERLLVRVRGSGVRALNLAERAFLDRMADAHERLAGVPSGPRRKQPRDPRHKLA